MKKATVRLAPDTGLMTPETITLDVLVMDERVQSRERLDLERVKEYTEAWKKGDRFLPIIVFYGGETYWVADGFHRVESARLAGMTEILADVRGGDIRAAIWYSAGSNTTHGLNRTDADKRRAVEMILKDEEWTRLSNRVIADHCRVGHSFVNRLKKEMAGSASSGIGFQLGNGQATTIGKDGRSRPASGRVVRRPGPVLPLDPEAACEVIVQHFKGDALEALARSLARQAGIEIVTEAAL